jgi:hypothetical protein
MHLVIGISTFRDNWEKFRNWIESKEYESADGRKTRPRWREYKIGELIFEKFAEKQVLRDLLPFEERSEMKGIPQLMETFNKFRKLLWRKLKPIDRAVFRKDHALQVQREVKRSQFWFRCVIFGRLEDGRNEDTKLENI